MVYADQRLLRRIRECFGFRHTDQKRANQPWTVGNCNRRHLLQTHMCLCQRLFNNLIHIHVAIHAESSAKDHILLFQCATFIFVKQFTVLRVIDRIVRFFAFLPCCRIFSGDHSLWLCTKFKMFMLDDPCIRNFIICIIDNRIALIISHIQHFCLKSQ